jgi:hypothetical protein
MLYHRQAGKPQIVDRAEATRVPSACLLWCVTLAAIRPLSIKQRDASDRLSCVLTGSWVLHGLSRDPGSLSAARPRWRAAAA